MAEFKPIWHPWIRKNCSRLGPLPSLVDPDED